MSKIALQLRMDVNMHIQLFDNRGRLKDERLIHNTVTAAGKAGVADQLLASPTLAKMGWMAIGTGTPGANALGAEISRVAFTSETRSANVVTSVASFGAGQGTGAITEAGTFDSAGANTGNMWMSASISPTINKGALDVLTITWTLTFS